MGRSINLFNTERAAGALGAGPGPDLPQKAGPGGRGEGRYSPNPEQGPLFHLHALHLHLGWRLNLWAFIFSLFVKSEAPGRFLRWSVSGIQEVRPEALKPLGMFHCCDPSEGGRGGPSEFYFGMQSPLMRGSRHFTSLIPAFSRE